MCKHYIGIDPGESGGMAVMNAKGDVLGLQAIKPLSMMGIYHWLVRYAKEDTFACMELVTGFIFGSESPGAHMFTFGANTGSIEMALTIMGIAPLRLKRPTPGVWQASLGIEPRYKTGKTFTESKPQFKSRMNKAAKAGFPEVKGITLQTCDSLLITEYCRRIHEGL